MNQSLNPQAVYIPQPIQIQTREPEIHICPKCQARVQTQVELKNGKGSWTFALLLIPKTLICCVVPLLMDDCKDAVHKCPFCEYELGKRRFLYK